MSSTHSLIATSVKLSIEMYFRQPIRAGLLSVMFSQYPRAAVSVHPFFHERVYKYYIKLQHMQ